MEQKKIYIVTGASGIAAATIRRLLEAGNKVFYVSNQASQCTHLAAELEQAGWPADYVVGDLCTETTAELLIAACMDKYGRIDGLFNVAGISGRKFGDGPLHQCTAEGWGKTLAANLDPLFFMTKHVLNQLLLQNAAGMSQGGVILNMSSVLAFAPEATHFSAITYAAAKGAVISMTKAAAAYYAADKIRINALAPGLVLTAMSARASGDPEILAWMKHKQPLAGSVMAADDIAKVASFLLSDAARMITGETITVDGGWSIS